MSMEMTRAQENRLDELTDAAAQFLAVLTELPMEDVDTPELTCGLIDSTVEWLLKEGVVERIYCPWGDDDGYYDYEDRADYYDAAERDAM